MVEGQIPIEAYETGNTIHKWDLKKIKFAHKILFNYIYKKGEVKRGYANRTLYINLSKKEIKEKKVTEEMKKKFTGGRGFGLKLMWDSINPLTRWNSDENNLLITTGPLCGTTQYAGSGKSLCLSISPATDIICNTCKSIDLYNYSLNFFISENSSKSAPPCLFHSCHFSPNVIKRKIKTAPIAIFCAFSS